MKHLTLKKTESSLASPIVLSLNRAVKRTCETNALLRPQPLNFLADLRPRKQICQSKLRGVLRHRYERS